jgi:uncharacterized phage infection (PIP) family protein YhgE
MRVTKNDVNILVEQILQKRKDEFEIKSQNFENEVEKYYRSIIDPKILEAYKTHPQYFARLFFSVRNCFGKNINVPTLRNCSYTPSDTNEKIIKLAAELCEMKEMIGKAKESLKAHLSSLRTFEKIKEQFPDVTLESKNKTMEVSLITPDLLSWIKK